jgi:hypothetical protein
MTHEEQQLINAIKALPNHQIFKGRLGGSVIIAITSPNGVRQQSVWLGRDHTIENLQSFLKTPWDRNGRYNTEFLGAQPARAGEDY